MEIWIDGDGCPVVRETERAARKFKIPVTIICDTSHRIESDYSRVKTVDKGADSADFVLTNLLKEGDIVVTQDYGAAAMALARKAYAFHQDGWQYTENNIDGLLMKRHLAKKAMRSGKHHLKGPPARSREAVKKGGLFLLLSLVHFALILSVFIVFIDVDGLGHDVGESDVPECLLFEVSIPL